eukprot:Awhi_evm1s8621
MTAIPWITFEDKIVINNEATSTLNSVTRPMNALSILGPARMGKSFLLNMLAEKPVFQTSSAPAACTSGIDICPEPVLFSKKIDTYLLDLEGQGDASEEHDVKVATPALLVSNVVILHLICGAGPTKTTILNTLKKFMVAAEYVSENVDHYKDLFGHLHIILRDCPNSEEECYNIIFDKEDTADLNKSKRKAAEERNEIRQSIGSSFKTSRVWTLPKLDIDSEIKAPERHRKIALDNTKYMDKVGEIRQYMTGQLESPNSLGGQTLTGPILTSFVSAIKETLESDAPQLNPKSIMRTILEQKINGLEKETLEKAKKLFTESERSFPIVEGESDVILAKIEKDCEGYLQKQVEKCLNVADVSKDFDLSNFHAQLSNFKSTARAKNLVALKKERDEEIKQMRTARADINADLANDPIRNSCYLAVKILKGNMRDNGKLDLNHGTEEDNRKLQEQMAIERKEKARMERERLRLIEEARRAEAQRQEELRLLKIERKREQKRQQEMLRRQEEEANRQLQLERQRAAQERQRQEDRMWFMMSMNDSYSSYGGGPLKADGTPDMRYKANW